MAERDWPSPEAPASDVRSLAEHMQASRTASQTVSGWLAGATATALLRAALDCGLLEAARTPVSVPEIAATGLQEPLVGDLCVALDAHGVLLREGAQYRLAPEIAFLLSPEAMRSLRILLDWSRAQGRALEGIGAVAPPASPAGRAVVAAIADEMPEVRAIWEAGGRHCELGCGVGGQLLGRLALFPRLTSVGVDMDGPLLEQARQTALRLGVADRVELRHIDARELRDDGAFDTLQWSQFFFPVESRYPGGHPPGAPAGRLPARAAAKVGVEFCRPTALAGWENLCRQPTRL